jgi:2Fe-2S ferredoxin
MLLTEHDGAGAGVAIVRVDPMGFDVAVPAGTSLMAAAAAAGVRWPSLCGGDAQCGVCAVEVIESGAPLAEPSLAEGQMLARLATRPRHGGTMRLACQWRPSAGARVAKPGVRAPK